MNTGVFPMHLIHLGQVKGLHTSILAFNITQFFLLLNHQLLPLIRDKADFNSRISSFFSNYLIGRKTQYMQNKNLLFLLFSLLFIFLLFFIFLKKELKISFQISISLFFLLQIMVFYLTEETLQKIKYSILLQL